MPRPDSVYLKCGFCFVVDTKIDFVYNFEDDSLW